MDEKTKTDSSISPQVAHYLQMLYEMINKLTLDVQQQMCQLEERMCLLEETVYGSSDVFDDEDKNEEDQMMK